MIKRWDDTGYEHKRPDTITVTLLKDGTVCDTRTRVYLKTPNAPGQRTFSRCAAPFFLEIRQYSCEKMSCSAQKFLAAGHIGSFQIHPISRTDSWQYTWSGLPRYNPDGTEIVWAIQENAVPGYISSIRETGDTFILTNTPEHQKLPQTGLLWWPVPVLAAAGLLLLILGTLLKRKNDHD